MPSIDVKPGEPFERALRRFKKAVDNANILNDVRERQEYVKPSTKRKRAKAAAVKREARRVSNDALGRNKK